MLVSPHDTASVMGGAIRNSPECNEIRSVVKEVIAAPETLIL